MVKSTTLDSFQASLSDTPEPEPVSVSNPLAELAEQMVSSRSQTDPPTREALAEQLQALDVLSQVDAQMALGEIKGRVREAAEAAGIPADYDLISSEAERIWAYYGDTRRASEATYTVSPDGLVNGYERTVATVTDSEGNSAELETPAGRAIITRSVAKALGVPESELPSIPPKPLKVPSDSIFGDDGEFAVSTALAQRARLLIERHPDHLDNIADLSVVYLWKKQGGKSKGRATFGKCSKPSGLLKHFAECQFVIWLAADHCRAAEFGDREIEALLFHEMLHMGVSEADENTGRGGGPTLVPHELEVFRAEVEIYGLWAPDLKEVGPAFQQASLFDQVADASGLDCADCGGFIDPERGGKICQHCEQIAEMERHEAAQAGYVENPTTGKPIRLIPGMGGGRVPDDGAGVLIHPDGTPLTAEEIAEQEAAELRDDDYLDDDEYPRKSDARCDRCDNPIIVVSQQQDRDLAKHVAAGGAAFCGCDDAGDEDEAVLPGDLAIEASDRRKWGPDA
jgi:hypothetical protein